MLHVKTLSLFFYLFTMLLYFILRLKSNHKQEIVSFSYTYYHHLITVKMSKPKIARAHKFELFGKHRKANKLLYDYP